MGRRLITDRNIRIRNMPTENLKNLATVVGTTSGSAVFDIVDYDKDSGWYQVKAYVHSSVVNSVFEAPVENPDESSIPYFSQWDADANKRTADCGQTCVKMVAARYGVFPRTNDLPYQSAANGLSTAKDLVMNFQMLGFSQASEVRIDKSEAMMSLKTGDIVLVSYGGFSRDEVQDVKFTGLHWVVFIRFDDTLEGMRVIVHDPNFFGTRRSEGAYKSYSLKDWTAATKNFTHLTVVRINSKL